LISVSISIDMGQSPSSTNIVAPPSSETLPTDVMSSSSSIHRDPNTLSNYHEWRTSHITADLAIEFEQKRCSGKVTLSMKRLEKGSKKIVLDASYLDIESVKLAGEQVKWNLAQRSEPYGSPLTIKVPETHAGDAELEIHLKTTKECTAVQWLTPDQTSNKKHPYMFSQCQAIHARSLLPCQDTPVCFDTSPFPFTSSPAD
jgi:leukotriene-A4 hydrolase